MFRPVYSPLQYVRVHVLHPTAVGASAVSSCLLWLFRPDCCGSWYVRLQVSVCVAEGCDAVSCVAVRCSAVRCLQYVAVTAMCCCVL